jgi:hypothetical protein
MEDKMMKTPEQEFLKALAVDLIDHKHFLEDEILNACKKYLASLEQNQCDITEKVEPEPAWKPEVGKLYRRKLNGVITEVIKAFLDNREFSKVAHKLIGVNYDTCHAHCDYASDFLEEYEPIAELEGLKVGDYAYSYINEWFVDNIDNGWITLTGHGLIDADVYGIAVDLSNRQLFWRTADRAERFGKSAG